MPVIAIPLAFRRAASRPWKRQTVQPFKAWHEYLLTTARFFAGKKIETDRRLNFFGAKNFSRKWDANTRQLGAFSRLGNGDFDDTPPALHPPILWLSGRGVRSGLQAAFFIRQLYGTAGLAAGLARALTQDDDK